MIHFKKKLKSQVEFKRNCINIYPSIFTFKFIHVTNQTTLETSWCPKNNNINKINIFPKENQIIISNILQNCQDDILKNNENNQTTLQKTNQYY
jgi:hypothetical protein